jgi:inorganic pyrophosphatase
MRKMEVCKGEAYNPIAQDVTKNNQPRSYHGPIYWNYGCFPQTWEDPSVIHKDLKCYGDK